MLPSFNVIPQKWVHIMKVSDLYNAPWIAKKIRYIKLGSGGKYWPICRDKKILIIGFHTGKTIIKDLMEEKDWVGIKKYWANNKCKTPTTHANSMKEYKEDDGTTLWITFADGRLYYAFTAGQVRYFKDEDQFFLMTMSQN